MAFLWHNSSVSHFARQLRPIALIFFSLFPLLGLSDTKAQEPPEAAISVSRVSAHLRFLASDELRGRLTGTPEHDIAARYIAEQFRSAGVEPLAEPGGYFQSIPLERVAPAEHGKLEILGRKLQYGEDFLVMNGETLDATAPMLFLGQGLAEQGSSQSLYRDAAGKIVIVESGKPGNTRLSPELTLEKMRLAREAGAAALIEIYKDRTWTFLKPYLTLPRLRLSSEDTPEAADSALVYVVMRLPDETLLGNLEAVPEAAVRLESSGVQRTPVEASNVIGVIPGSDPERRDEYVVLMAHYDHLGADPQQPGATAEDFIFNGARDNAMGVTALLAAAESLAAHPPARSILLLAVTAEEAGLLGSAYYVEHPVIPLRQTVFVLNVDGGGFSDTGVATVIGLDRTSASTQIRSASRAVGVEAIPGPAEAQPFFDRSDNLNFARKGVPAPTFSAGFRTLDGSTMAHYHRPSDEAGEDFDYSYLLRFCQAYAASARAVADSPTRPQWSDGDLYAEAARRLYEGNP